MLIVPDVAANYKTFNLCFMTEKYTKNKRAEYFKVVINMTITFFF